MTETLDKEDLAIERGEADPAGEGLLYPKGVLYVLNAIFKSKKFPRPRGKRSPKFSNKEIEAITALLFFKPRHIVLKVYERMPRNKEMPLKRKMFINHFLGDAKFNGAKAARMAGYSPQSAKQIAYKIKQT